MKKALVILNDKLAKVCPGQFAFLANVHDQWQIQCEPSLAKFIGDAGCAAIVQAGVRLGLRVPMSGQYKIGNNWAECH